MLIKVHFHYFSSFLALTMYLKKIPRIETEDEHSDSPVEVPKISYTVSTFSLEELKKSATCHKPKSCLIDLSSDLEWVDVKAHLKIIIYDLLFPQLAVVEDAHYDMA